MFARSMLIRRAAFPMAVVLVASLLVGQPAQAKPSAERLKPPVEQLDTHGGQVAGKGWGPRPQLKDAPAKVSWPKPGAASIELSETRGFTAGGPIRAGALPVWMEELNSTPTQVSVELLDRAKVPAAWRDSVLLKVSPQRGGKIGKVKIAVDYAEFRDAVGGGWSSRLRLWWVPPCALSTPDLPQCQGSALASVNDPAARRVSGEVPVDGGGFVALSGGASGSGGDFTATPFLPSATWSAGGNSGGFTWSYPLRVPPATGPKPTVSFAYSSQSVDGRSEATNNQPSWLGEGFEYSSGYIERRYVPCGENMGNGANNSVRTGDLCWKSDNATLNLNGSGGEVIRDSSTGWHLRSEDGSKIEKLTGASNGDNNGEYWKVIGQDGTQYFFGLDDLPGQTSATDSAWTVPVFGNHSGEPCHESSFASSSCSQVWRWNLDYVVDPRGNTMSLWYAKETNKYARNLTDSDDVSYVRGGYPTRIDYGTYNRTTAEHGVTESSVAPVGQVAFAVADRCVAASCWDGSDPVTENWKDVPWDQECKASATACPGLFSPTFWSTKRLSKVTTKVWDTTKPTPAWQDVDSWTLTHSLPSPGDGTSPGLWLDSIVHSGHVGGTVALPPVTLEPVSMPNRVLTPTNTTNSWLRISNIITEAGGKIHIDYSLPECTASNLPSNAYTNGMRCYPVLVPDYSADPSGDTLKTEWWHKYVVTHIAEDDVPLADGHESVPKHTHYEYVGNPAWHYADDDGLTKPKFKTWSQYRGYATVKVRVGSDPAQQTLTVTKFMRGMHGDKASPSGGTRSVQVPASLGSETVWDEDQFAGMRREQITYNGVESKPVSKTVKVPWRSNPTASRTINGDLVEARFTNTQITYGATALGVDGAGGWRVAKTAHQFDQTYGTTNSSQDDGDIGVSGDEKCTSYVYNRNTTKNIVATVKRATVTALPCGQAPATVDDVISDVRNYYDGATSADTAPLYGSVTKVEQMKAWTAGSGTEWQTVSQATFDPAGRNRTSTDIKGNTTTTAYTPAVGGPSTKATITGPAPFNWLSYVDLSPYWGTSLKAVDANGRITAEAEYDPLGRVSKGWQLGLPKSSNPTKPSVEYIYTLPPNRDNYTVLTTKTLNADGNYITSHQIFDGMLRPRQTQSISLNGDGSRVVTDTVYDSLGRTAVAYNSHAEPGAPAGTLWWEPEWSVPSVTKTEYDRASRVTASVLLAGDGETNLVEKWRTTTVYEGNVTKIVPPLGGVATTTVSDIKGRTVALRQHTTEAGIGGAYLENTYEYNRKGQKVKVVDPDGNEWTWTYDLKGRQTSATDPDAGTTTKEYNDANELTKTTDARNEVLFYVYDQIGRKTQLRDDSETGALRAEWKYDTLYTGQSGFRGQLTQTVRYEPPGSANAYRWRVGQFDGRYQPSGMNIVIPAVETGLAGTYSFGNTYSQYNGAQISTVYSGGGGLVNETVTIDYDSVTGMPARLDTSLTGFSGTMLAAWYNAYGQPVITTKKMPNDVYVDDTVEYDEATGRVERTTIQTETGTGTVSDREYKHDPAGNIIAIDDDPEVGSRDTQCFRYDPLGRLTTAWTPNGSTPCATDPATANLGGPAPYWLDWTFNNTGSRLSETSHAAAGDTTRTYTVPAGGQGVVRPHANTTMTSTPLGGSATTVNYTYDASGNTLCRPSASAANNCSTGAGSQALAWNAEGRLETVSVGGSVTQTNIYDAEGNRLIRRDSTGTTLYLPGQELRREGTVITGTRYYTWNGQICASRYNASPSSNLTWLYNDHQETQQVAINAATQAVTIRRQTPYGQTRGAGPTWPNTKGFVGGTNDPTNLMHIGAREYDSTLGRFISVDPIMAMVDPQQWHGYAYSHNSPITFSDPSGLLDLCGEMTVECPAPSDNSGGDGCYDGNMSPSCDGGGGGGNGGGPGPGCFGGDVSTGACDGDSSGGGSLTIADVIDSSFRLHLNDAGFSDPDDFFDSVCGDNSLVCKQIYRQIIENMGGRAFDCGAFPNADQCRSNFDHWIKLAYRHLEFYYGYCSIICGDLEFQGGVFQLVVGVGAGGTGGGINWNTVYAREQSPLSFQACVAVEWGGCIGFNPQVDESGELARNKWWSLYGGVTYGVAETKPIFGYNLVSFDTHNGQWQGPQDPIPPSWASYVEDNCRQIWWCS